MRDASDDEVADELEELDDHHEQHDGREHHVAVVAVVAVVDREGALSADDESLSPAHLELAAEGLEAWSVDEVWVMTAGGGAANRYVDVTDTFERKLAALKAHVSQTAHMEDLEGMLRTWLAVNAVQAGYGEDRLAESFRVVNTA